MAEGLIELVGKDRGTLHLYVHEPESADQPKRVGADPQVELNFDAEPTGVCAQKPPGVCAQEPPHASSVEMQQTEEAERVTLKIAETETGVCAQEPPDPSMVTIEIPKVSQQPSSIEQPGSHGTMVSKADNLVSDAMRYARRREQRRIERSDAKPVSGAIVDAINRFSDNSTPESLKQELVREIMSRGYPNLHEAVAGRAADAVAFDGLPRKFFSQALEEVELAISKGKARNPGALFQHKMKLFCDQNGIRWRDGKEGKS